MLILWSSAWFNLQTPMVSENDKQIIKEVILLEIRDTQCVDYFQIGHLCFLYYFAFLFQI